MVRARKEAPFLALLPQRRSLDGPDAELRNQATQPARFFGKCIGGYIRLLDHGGILLGRLIHRIHGGVDFCQIGRSFRG